MRLNRTGSGKWRPGGEGRRDDGGWEGVREWGRGGRVFTLKDGQTTGGSKCQVIIVCAKIPVQSERGDSKSSSSSSSSSSLSLSSSSHHILS